jgi:hypothetical protein
MQVNWFEFCLDFGILGFLGLLGALFIWKGLKRRATSPRCWGCGYGMEMARSLTCPDCGHVARDQVELLRGRVRWGRLIVGVLLVMPLAMGMWVAWQQDAWGKLSSGVWSRLEKAKAMGRLDVSAGSLSMPRQVPPGPMEWVRVLAAQTAGPGGQSTPMPLHTGEGWGHRHQVPWVMRWVCYAVDFAWCPVEHLERHFEVRPISHVTFRHPTQQDIEDVVWWGTAEMVEIAYVAEDWRQEVYRPEIYRALKVLRGVNRLRVDGPDCDVYLPQLLDAWPEVNQLDVPNYETYTCGDSVLEAVGRHPKLENVMLEFSSKVTDKGFEGLTRSRSIRQLWRVQLRGLSPKARASLAQMQQLVQLEMLDVEDDDLATVGKIEELRRLVLWPAKGKPKTWRNVAAMGGLKKLGTLDLRGPVTGPIAAGAGEFTVLEWLMVTLENPDGLVEVGDLRAMTSLNGLSLQVKTPLKAGEWAKLGTLKNLKSLALFVECDVGDEELGFLSGLTMLKDLHMEFTGAKQPSGRWIAGLPKAIEPVSLTVFQKTLEQVFFDALGASELDTVMLWGARGDGVSLKPMSSGGKITSVQFDASFVGTDDDLTWLGQMGGLKFLEMYGKFSPQGMMPVSRQTLREQRVALHVTQSWTKEQQQAYEELRKNGKLKSDYYFEK